MKKNKIIYITFFIIIFCIFFCSCSNDQQKQNAITDPQEYVNNLAQQGYTSVYNSFVFEKTDKNKKTWTAPFAGIKTFKIPVDMINAKGTIAAAGGSESIPGSGLVAVDVLYMAMTEAEYKQTVGNLALYSYYAGSDAGALQAYQQLAGAYTSSATPLFSVYGMKGQVSADELKSAIKDIYVKYAGMEESLAATAVSMMDIYPAGTINDYSFFLVQNGMQDKETFAASKNTDYYDEYQYLYNNSKKYTGAFTFQRPIGLTEVKIDNEGIIFETKDLKGNIVKSKDLFTAAKVTMINIWSTTCSVCLTEIPVLQQMNDKYKPEGGQIVGLLYDGDDPAAAQEAAEFLEEYGIEYTNITANDELKNIFPTQSFPMTYFFDSEGKMIGEPVIGADLEKYELRLKELLQGQ